MTTTQSNRPFGYTVTVEGEQTASGTAALPEWFDGDLVRLSAWVAWRWFRNDCQVPADAPCPVVTVAATHDGETAVYSA